MDTINFRDKRCQEIISSVGTILIKCERPAVKIIYHERDGKHFYFMCDMCASHSLKNRGAIELVPAGGG